MNSIRFAVRKIDSLLLLHRSLPHLPWLGLRLNRTAKPLFLLRLCRHFEGNLSRDEMELSNIANEICHNRI